MTLVAYTDGASRGNPGESGVGVIVKDERGTVVLSLNGYIGRATNNIAEYTALITLLERMRLLSCSKLTVHSDSELMVHQVNGKYKVKNRKLKLLHARVLELRSALPFAVEMRYVPRTENRDADRLANLGIESREPLPRIGSSGPRV
jgi:ribonuclease HI